MYSNVLFENNFKLILNIIHYFKYLTLYESKKLFENLYENLYENFNKLL